MMLPFNPFSILTSKIFAGGLLLAIAGCSVQTARIEGIYCSDPKSDTDKLSCLLRGYKQDIRAIRIDFRAMRSARDTEVAKHQATKRAYQDAQAEAERLETERLARVTRQQQEITDEIVSDYDRRLRDARARAERLRSQGQRRGGAAGASGRQPVPSASAAAGRADEAARDHGFSDAERLIATEQALQLDALIDWNERQARVPAN